MHFLNWLEWDWKTNVSPAVTEGNAFLCFHKEITFLRRSCFPKTFCLRKDEDWGEFMKVWCFWTYPSFCKEYWSVSHGTFILPSGQNDITPLVYAQSVLSDAFSIKVCLSQSYYPTVCLFLANISSSDKYTMVKSMRLEDTKLAEVSWYDMALFTFIYFWLLLFLLFYCYLM